MKEDTYNKYANYIVRKASEANIALPNKLLQKILFYAYVEYARNKKEALFSNEFCAWNDGPVLEEVYLDYDFIVKPTKSVEDISVDKEFYLDNAFYLLVDKNMNTIIHKTQRIDDSKSPWLMHYTNDTDEIIYEDNDIISFEEIRDYYSIEDNYNNLITFI